MVVIYRSMNKENTRKQCTIVLFLIQKLYSFDPVQCCFSAVWGPCWDNFPVFGGKKITCPFHLKFSPRSCNSTCILRR